MVVVAGTGNRSLAAAVSASAGTELTACGIEHLPDGELGFDSQAAGVRCRFLVDV